MRKGGTLRKLLVTVCVVGVFATFAGSALAGGSLVAGYGGEATTPQVITVSAVAPIKAQGTTPTKGSLPFTGMDVGFILAGGMVLLLSGAALRRGAKNQS